MPFVYRGMIPNVDGTGPMVADNNANTLGVRAQPDSKFPDVKTYQQNEVPWVAPTDAGTPQGISVASESGCNLPRHRRPKGAPWNGTGVMGLKVWQLDTTTLTANELQSVHAPLADQPQHYVISPGIMMSLANYRGYIADTKDHWAPAPDPAAPCQGLLVRGADVVEPHLEQLADATASGARSDDLVTALVQANGQGVSASILVAGVETAIQRAESTGNDEGAETLRSVLDRVTGYCAPSDRIELT